MTSLNMNGLYDLTKQKIENTITKKSAGNYALGYLNDKDVFIVLYVGRSDSDLKERLLSWVEKQSKYKKFKYSYADSAKEAFLKECTNFHDFGGTEKLNNEIHPDRPKNLDWKCPKCKIFD